MSISEELGKKLSLNDILLIQNLIIKEIKYLNSYKYQNSSVKYKLDRLYTIMRDINKILKENGYD